MKAFDRHIRDLAVRKQQSRHAVALLAWIGVLAVLIILTTFLLRALLREIDFRVARNESATLEILGNALQSAVVRHDYIPAATNWAEFVAPEAGMSVASVTSNARGRSRVLLIDTSGWFTNVSLPYTQTDAGNTNLPVNARMIIASSLGATLPLTNGPLNAGEFSTLWQAAEGTTNFPTTGVWSGWPGRSDDVKLERINLSSRFISLRLMTYEPGGPQGLYSIGTNTTLHPAPYRNDQVPLAPTYYVQGTVLKLYSETTNLDSTQILNRDSSFLYQNGIWKSSSAGGSMPEGVDIAGVVYSFLNAVPNTNARNGDAQQKLVVQSMMNYMSNYIAWANGNFTDTSLKSYLLNTAQPDMIATIQDLFQGAYYPTNASGPQ